MSLAAKYILTVVALIGIMGFLTVVSNSMKETETHPELLNDNEKVVHPVYGEGDIVFQNSPAKNSIQIQKMTHSRWNQMGVLFNVHGEWYVFEATDRVLFTRVGEWIDRGKEGKFEVRRLKNADKILTDSALMKMRTFTEDFQSRGYDLFYSRNDELLYNAELVYKMFLYCLGIKLGEYTPLKDCDFSNPDTKKLFTIKYGNVISKDSLIISPQQLYQSDRLYTAYIRE